VALLYLIAINIVKAVEPQAIGDGVSVTPSASLGVEHIFLEYIYIL
jgi:hypothetical protein